MRVASLLPSLLATGLLGPSASADPFDRYLHPEVPTTDGFDFPVGTPDGDGSYTDPKTGRQHRGWYVATHFNEAYALGLHPGEDWNGRGGGDTDLGQPVHSIGRGKVAFAAFADDPWGGVVMIDHAYYDNHHLRIVRSQYAHLSRIDVKVGQTVSRRQTIGAIGKNPAKTFPAHLHFELRTDRSLAATYWPSSHGRSATWIRDHYVEPRPFIEAHRQLFVPSEEPVLILVDEATHRLARYRRGKKTHEVEVGFGQAAGRKRVQGDLKTPKGMYFAVHRYRGKFTGTYAAYYGGHWIKLNYPNAYDADWGVAQGKLTKAKAQQIRERWRARKLTDQKTFLGGGIGFHGWAGAWRLTDGGRLSWGCMVLHNEDIAALFDEIPLGAMVVIF